MSDTWEGRWVAVPYDGSYDIEFMSSSKETVTITRDTQGVFLFADESVKDESERLIKRIADDDSYTEIESYWEDTQSDLEDDFNNAQLGK